MTLKVEQKHSARIRGLLEGRRYAVLATREPDGKPYTNLVAFQVSEDLDRILFCTPRATRKYANLEAEPRVAMLVDDRTDRESDLQNAGAVTVIGECEEVRGEERMRLGEQFLSRHPSLAELVRSPECALMSVIVRECHLVTGFQETSASRGGEIRGRGPS